MRDSLVHEFDVLPWLTGDQITAIAIRKPRVPRLAPGGPAVGANLDPGHLIWMGVDPFAAVRAFRSAISHVHAKETRIEPAASTRTLLETLSPERMSDRSWNYATVGYGQGRTFWREVCVALQAVVYTGTPVSSTRMCSSTRSKVSGAPRNPCPARSYGRLRRGPRSRFDQCIACTSILGQTNPIPGQAKVAQ